MCLKIFLRKVEVATEDIVVYKVVEKSHLPNCSRYFTPYQRMVVRIGVTYSLDGSLSHCIKGKYLRYYYIDTGAFHSFATLSDARAYCLSGNEDFLKYVKICKCIIPKGTEYIKGEFFTFDGSYSAYASKAIKYVEIV